MRFRQSDIKVRMAEDPDGLRIGELARSIGIEIDLDWSRVAPYWILAELCGELVGAVQICPGRPIGRVELLFLSNEMPHRVRAIAVKQLGGAALLLHRENGSQLVMGIVPTALEGYRKLLERHFNAVVAESGHMMMVRI